MTDFKGRVRKNVPPDVAEEAGHDRTRNAQLPTLWLTAASRKTPGAERCLHEVQMKLN